MIDINFFYDRNGLDIRSWVNTPFNVGDYTVATNGHILLIQPTIDEFSGIKLTPPKNIAEIVSRIVLHPYQPVTELPELPEKFACNTCKGTGKATEKKCDECGGSGEVELWSGKHYYDFRCKTCHGDGTTAKPGGDIPCNNCSGTGKVFGKNDMSARNQPVEWEGIKIAARYAELIIDEPDLQINIDSEKGMFCFKSGNQYGGIMKLNN